MAEVTGVLVMAYGTPTGLDEVEAYYTDIRHGRPPSREQLAELTDRYRAIGGRSPLLEITRAQMRGMGDRLEGVRAYLGQKHASPTIRDAVQKMAVDEIERAVGVVLAPHYSSISIGDYASRAERAAEELSWNGKLEMVESWHLEPGYIRFLSLEVERALASLPPEARANSVVLFTAHSLPERILQKKDPYPDQLEETADAVAGLASLERWQVGWQSAGRTPDPWLGPDVLEILDKLHAGGVSGVVVCPCGFVSDHLEVLYDLDIEAATKAKGLGLSFARTRSPNDDPAFLDTLADIVRKRLARHP